MGSIKEIMKEYDDWRIEEVRFSAYWKKNLQEIT